MRTPEELTEVFRERGLKVTPQRQFIFRVLYANDLHPTAEGVHAAVVAELPTVSLRTVYQTLNDLADMGEIQAFDLGTGAARFDPNTDAHYHAVCNGCGVVRDIDRGGSESGPRRRPLPGFTVQSTEIVYRGLCDECASHSTAKEKISHG